MKGKAHGDKWTNNQQIMLAYCHNYCKVGLDLFAGKSIRECWLAFVLAAIDTFESPLISGGHYRLLIFGLAIALAQSCRRLEIQKSQLEIVMGFDYACPTNTLLNLWVGRWLFRFCCIKTELMLIYK